MSDKSKTKARTKPKSTVSFSLSDPAFPGLEEKWGKFCAENQHMNQSYILRAVLKRALDDGYLETVLET